MQQLLGRDENIAITENVVKKAAWNWPSGKEVMQLLLTQGENIAITEDVVKIIASNFDGETMQL
jgi:hypothetical protein